jgi:hypothetical protein
MVRSRLMACGFLVAISYSSVVVAQGIGVPGAPGVGGPRLTQPGIMQPRTGNASGTGQRPSGGMSGSRAAQANVLNQPRNMNTGNLTRVNSGGNVLRSGRQFQQQSIMGATRGMAGGRSR